MKIRSITYFDNLQWPLDQESIQQALDFIAIARNTFQAGGFEVQTTRLACQAKVEMSLFLQSRDVPFLGNTCRLRRACGKVVSALLSTFP